jgi:predicted alpha-1,2-mannosidase
MKKTKLSLWIVLIILLAYSCNKKGNEAENVKSPIDYVNPYMGNISHLLVPTFPTIHLPNSMFRIYPERRDYTGITLKGLPLIVTGHRRSSAFNLSPFQGEEEDIKAVIDYSYDQEKLTPYSYAVLLDEDNIKVDFAMSHQSAAYEITFDKDAPPYLIVNSITGAISWDEEGIEAYQLIENDTRIFMYMESDIQPQKVMSLKEASLNDEKNASGENSCLVLKYPQGTKKINLHYGISFIDQEQAMKNMQREVEGKSVDQLQSKARDIWNEALGKIKIEGGSEDEKTVFYTSLYRCYERPVCLSEDGRYFSAFDGKIHDDEGRPFYTDDWIWDSYRAHHPLRILIDAEREEDILHSFILMAEQMENFWMPTFPEVSGDSRRMNSNHGVASIIDAYRKGLTNFDLEKAYFAAKGAITEKTLAPWSGMKAGVLDQFFKDKGYFPALHDGESETIPEVHPFESRQPVAVTLGTVYDEWCLAQIAKELNKMDEYRYFLERSYNYRKLYNSSTGFFHPKDNKGKFIEPFDYKFSGGMGARKYYGENNAWTYRWDVQHNIKDLINLMGGRDQFIKNLDATFKEELGRSKYAFYAQLPDQTGNVGQFSMANEPSLHIPYLYNYAGQPWKTQKRIRKLIKEWFRNDLMGVPGDEDGGGMSAFVVFSQLGFYPVIPGSPTYNLGSPVFDHSKIDLGNGKVFEIIAENVSEDNKYIQSVILNGQDWMKPWFSHSDISNGGKLVLKMGPIANIEWGADAQYAPPSAEKILRD